MDKTLKDELDDIFQFRWGWACQWFGWRRMLWFAVAIDFRLRLAYIIVFGLALSYGRQLIAPNVTTTTSARVAK